MIKNLSVRNFQGFNDFEAEGFTPINIIIGENDSGKTGILKLLYGIAKSYEDFHTKEAFFERNYSIFLSEKLLNTFQPLKNGLGELVKKGSNGKLEVSVQFDDMGRHNSLRFSFGESTVKRIIDCEYDIDLNYKNNTFNTLFIPSKEVLTTFRAIALTREQYNMPGFDDTYYDLILALRVPVRESSADLLNNVNRDLEDLFEGVIVQNRDPHNDKLPFIFKKGNTEFTMPLTAEGIKKIGILTTLIRNRKLTQNTVLFMDEPETALHPKAVRSLAEMIVDMSQAGVQIFLSSHNYFMIKQLSIIAKKRELNMNCISLKKNTDKQIEYEIQNIKDGLPNNPIIEEALQMFNEDIHTELGL